MIIKSIESSSCWKPCGITFRECFVILVGRQDKTEGKKNTYRIYWKDFTVAVTSVDV